jgi:hypothetical protein
LAEVFFFSAEERGFFFVAEKGDFLLRRAESWRCRRVVDFVGNVEMVVGVAADGGSVVPVIGGRTGGVAGVVVSRTGGLLDEFIGSDGLASVI